jgi:flagellum-specific peptidoglycan hydrolase FlgJ
MTPREFVKRYYPFARASELKHKLPAASVLTQSALETGWGNTVVGNMMFGVKDTDGLNGNEQLIKTTEYHDQPDKKYPVVIKVIQVGKKRWKYWVKDWFRKYLTPEDSFNDHARVILQAPRYNKAISVCNDPEMFLREIAKAGYATADNYETELIAVLRLVQKIIKEEKL